MEQIRDAGPGLARRAASVLGGALVAGVRGFVDAVVPAVCLGCQAPLAGTDGLCGGCWRSIRFIRPPLCDRLGLPMPYGAADTMISAAAAADPPVYNRARAVASYEGAMRELIHAFKYADRHDARRLFGRWLAHAGEALLPGIDLVVPVPLTRARLLRRQYNQAAMLAQEVARRTGVKFEPGVLERTRATRAQVGLSHAERRRNVRGAFGVARQWAGSVAGLSILLIDDVITTGATVEACARALKAASAMRVDVLALALVTDPRQVSL